MCVVHCLLGFGTVREVFCREDQIGHIVVNYRGRGRVNEGFGGAKLHDVFEQNLGSLDVDILVDLTGVPLAQH